MWTQTLETELRIKLEALDESFDAFDASSQLILVGDGKDPEFYAPLDLLKGVPLEANSPARLSPRPHRPIDLRITPGTLRWGRWIGAVWPRLSLFEVVPRGKYHLYLNVSTRSTNEVGKEFWRSNRSNTIEVRIE